MIKKITNKDVMKLRIGDEIMLYGITDNAKVVTKKFFRVVNAPSPVGVNNSIIVVLHKIKEDGTPIRDRWTGFTREVRIQWFKDKDYFIDFSGVITRLYTDPKIPCEMVIKNLREEKRKINKKIMDCQRFMYQIEEV
jgi:hypothetical protein